MALPLRRNGTIGIWDDSEVFNVGLSVVHVSSTFLYGRIRMRLIVNADDFGLNERVTSAILECFQKGWINQTTLLVNSPYAEESVKRAREEGVSDRIGLHLNFTEGIPLTEPIKYFREVCDAEGRFYRNQTGIRGFGPFKSKVFREAIRLETRAQVERYCDYRLPLMHCDGHHHVHNRSQFMYDVLPILKAKGFKSVRNRYSIRSRFPIRGMRWVFQRWLFCRMARKNGLTTTDGFGAWEGESLQYLRAYPSYEIMVHPNYDADGHNVNVLNFAKITGPGMSLLRNEIEKSGVCLK